MHPTSQPGLRSWVPVPDGSDFPIQNLPYGVFSTADRGPRAGVAIGEYILDLAATAMQGYFDDLGFHSGVFERPVLNDFIALGQPVWQKVRQRISDLLREHSSAQAFADRLLVRQKDACLHLPIQIGDYTDFYSSLEHATNVGVMFRGKDNALMPNWKHMPIGYHGRSSSIFVSGTDIHRPKGQMMPEGATAPLFGPSKALDFELEVAFVVGKNTRPGEHVPVRQAENHIFGLLLFNDWSARDLQKWEYQPLGPFLGKNFGSTVSPWIVTMDALEPFRTASPMQDVAVLPYLQTKEDHAFDIVLDVFLQPENGQETRISQSNFKYLYWSMPQQLAHHTINGCNIRVGDLYASGTISGPEKHMFGSMLELTWGGKEPLTLAEGQERKFIADGDSLIIRGYCQRDGLRIGFGEAKGKVLPALPL